MRLVAFSRHPALEFALERGLFAAEGLDVSIARAKSSRAQLDALLSGEYDVAHTAADNVVARVDAGDDLRIVLVADRGAEHRLIGGPAVRTTSEMAGRRLGVDAAESGHAVLAYVMLAEAGVARERYDVVPVGSTSERYAALVDGRIDAAMLNAPHDERALAAGCHVVADARRRFPRHPGLTVAVAGVWARTHRSEVEGYCRALLTAAREVRGSVPSVDEMADAISEVCAARRVARLASGPYDTRRYFDASYVRR